MDAFAAIELRPAARLPRALACTSNGCTRRGFTLIELVVLLALLGILSFVALSRSGSTDAFAQHAAAEELAGAMRFAQKRAVAAHASVWVRIDVAARRVDFCLDAALACAQPLQAPGAGAALSFQAPAAVTLAVVPGGLSVVNFDTLGRIAGGSGATTQLVLDSASAVATVETWNETGLTETSWTNK